MNHIGEIVDVAIAHFEIGDRVRLKPGLKKSGLISGAKYIVNDTFGDMYLPKVFDDSKVCKSCEHYVKCKNGTNETCLAAHCVLSQLVNLLVDLEYVEKSVDSSLLEPFI